MVVLKEKENALRRCKVIIASKHQITDLILHMDITQIFLNSFYYTELHRSLAINLKHTKDQQDFGMQGQH